MRVTHVSDRLAVSAAFSVLMMAAFVLLGPGSARVDFAPGALRAQSSLTASASISATGASLLSIN
jgi:hypothetical protein